jgi:hypothetical protein
MANKETLKRFGYEKPPLSQEEAKKNGSIGGQASVIARREQSEMRRQWQVFLNMSTKDDKGDEKTMRDQMIASVGKMILRTGDATALEKVAKMAGEYVEAHDIDVTNNGHRLLEDYLEVISNGKTLHKKE